MNESTALQEMESNPIEYLGVRVVTLRQIDEAHGRPDGTAKRNLQRHRSRLVINEDYFEVNQQDEFRPSGISRPQGGNSGKAVLLTESGYLMIVKSFTDDLSWQVQRQLVNSYFRKCEKPRQNKQDQISSAIELAKALLELKSENDVLSYFEPRTPPGTVSDSNGNRRMRIRSGCFYARSGDDERDVQLPAPFMQLTIWR